MRLEKFAFCFELELGGMIIGFYHLIMNCLAIIVEITAFVLALIYGELKIEISSVMCHNVRVSGEDLSLILLVIGLICGLLIALFLLYISYQLIMGVEYVRKVKTCIRMNIDNLVIFQRDHRRVQKFRIVCFIGLFINILIAIAILTQMGRFNLNGLQVIFLIIYVTISFITQIYIFIVVDSIYKKFREEEYPTSYSPAQPRAFNA